MLKDGVIEKNMRDRMGMAKNYMAHCSAINQIHIQNNKMYTCAMNGECILEWELHEDSK